MKIALGQLNPLVADLAGNCDKVRAAYRQAVAGGAELVVFSEMVVTGYPPLDLLGRDDFLRRAESAVHALARDVGVVPCLVGCVLPNPDPTGRPIQNCAAVLADGRLQAVVAKSRLPTYDVFDEDRYFEPARERRVMEVGGRRLAVTLCEDIWPGPIEGRNRYAVDPVAELAEQGFDLLLNLSASPFHAGRGKEREAHLIGLARRLGRPVALCNQVGGDDSLLFDGRSLVVGPDGRLLARAEAFREDQVQADLVAGSGDMRPVPPEGPAEIYRALVMGLSDYMRKCHFQRAVLGLSGGVDSAVVAALAAEALGGDRVTALAMPSMYSSPHSKIDAQVLAERLGLDFVHLPITPAHEALRAVLRPTLGEVAGSLTDENLQARIRGALVMAVSNQRGCLSLATGNKSELATGYCTLYGDMAGGLAPIGDLLKGQVYELARLLNRAEPIIPERILTRPPSAELRPDQTDQDSLPPYEVLDPILDGYLTEGLAPDELVARGHPAAVVEEVIQLVERSEYKRRQAAPVLRVTRRAFGAGRQIPLARATGR